MMTREEAITQYIVPAIEKTWNDKRCKEILEALEQEPKWIPVSERLPEEDGQYLITVKYKPEANYEDIYTEHGEWTDGQWDMSCVGHCGEVEDIVAWMPLPKPYEPLESDIEKRKPCINYKDGCEEWAGCPCVYYKAESEVEA